VSLAFVFGVVAGFALVPGVAGASGGGGCGGPVTDEAGMEVEIKEFCFTPTILRTEPGDTITFTNLDRSPHTVLGANGIWGSYDALKRNVEGTYEFAEPGVYPYVCTWHVGMVGVVVVGEGARGAIETTTADGPVIAAELAGGRADSTSSGASPWIASAAAAGVIVGLLAFAAANGIRRTRKGPTASVETTRRR
jgi:plastocyanin